MELERPTGISESWRISSPRALKQTWPWLKTVLNSVYANPTPILFMLNMIGSPNALVENMPRLPTTSTVKGHGSVPVGGQVVSLCADS